MPPCSSTKLSFIQISFVDASREMNETRTIFLCRLSRHKYARNPCTPWRGSHHELKSVRKTQHYIRCVIRILYSLPNRIQFKKGEYMYLSWWKACARFTSKCFFTAGLKTASQSSPSFLRSCGTLVASTYSKKVLLLFEILGLGMYNREVVASPEGAQAIFSERAISVFHRFDERDSSS